MDRITLKSLEFNAKHGHNEQERIDGNRFEVDVIAFGYFRRSVPAEDLTKTFDYAKAEELVRSVMVGESRKLIETLCANIGDSIFKASPAVLRLSVSVRKLSPPVETSAAYSEITMEWNR